MYRAIKVNNEVFAKEIKKEDIPLLELEKQDFSSPIVLADNLEDIARLFKVELEDIVKYTLIIGAYGNNNQG